MPYRHKIGEGGFGCVHIPSLHCSKKEKSDNSNIDYSQYISKLMKKKSAKTELEDFVIVSKADPENKYHLGTPIMCTPDVDNEDTIHDINECKRFTAREVQENPDNYRLLLLKNGGNDLSIFCKEHLTYFVNENPKNVYRFWAEASHLIKGIHFFNSQNIIHYDLKPQNIVFNPITFKLMFIDFGLMDTKNNIRTEAKRSSLSSANFHWSYPIDNGFLNKDYFNYYKNLSVRKKEVFKNTFMKYLFTDSEVTSNSEVDLYIRKPHSFYLIFDYIYLYERDADNRKYDDIELFFNTFNHFISENSYDSTIEKTINSIDIYGLGFTLKYMLNQFFLANAIPMDFYDMYSTLFESMYSFDFYRRMDDTKKVLEDYDNILKKSDIQGILKEPETDALLLKPNILFEEKFGEKIGGQFEGTFKKS